MVKHPPFIYMSGKAFNIYQEAELIMVMFGTPFDPHMLRAETVKCSGLGSQEKNNRLCSQSRNDVSTLSPISHKDTFQSRSAMSSYMCKSLESALNPGVFCDGGR